MLGSILGAGYADYRDYFPSGAGQFISSLILIFSSILGAGVKSLPLLLIIC